MENFDHYVMTFASDIAEAVFHSISAWADPYDQFTIEDRQASWNICVGQFTTLTPPFPCVGLFNIMLLSVCNLRATAYMAYNSAYMPRQFRLSVRLSVRHTRVLYQNG